MCHVFIYPNWIMDDSRNSIQSGSADSASTKLLYKGSTLPSVGYHRHKTYENQSVYCFKYYFLQLLKPFSDHRMNSFIDIPSFIFTNVEL